MIPSGLSERIALTLSCTSQMNYTKEARREEAKS
jgi:hypothetical protein